MNLRLLFVLFVFVFSATVTNAQDLLDTSTWTVGSGSVGGFYRNGEVSENVREFGTDPFGNSSILWKGGNDSANNADGGWNSSYYNIDNEETYRFVVWLKKTNSTDGHSYFGCQQWQSSTDTNLYDYTILKLNDDIGPNPYFWVGELPQLNKWYMLVGYVHGKSYNSNLSYGGIYDPISGTKVVNIEDFKFAPTTTKLRHRAYLYYDTNISDRQFFFAPRMEMVDGNEPPIADLLGLNGIDNNMYNLSGWNVGTGNITDFNQYGATSSNLRELGNNHVGEELTLWKATPNPSSNAEGGIYGHYKAIDKTKTYRLSVWVKKTNSNDGTTYFGCHSHNGSHQTLNLSGSVNSNPYFWYGDLPKLNHWYLLTGYVHQQNYTGAILGKIYDGATGEAISNIQREFKFSSSATNLRLRSFLYNDPNLSDRQYLVEPRMELIDGSESTLEELLSINPDSKLIFSYDVAGNQKQRFYCEEKGFCSPVAPESRMINEEGVKIQEEQGVVVAEQIDVPLPREEIKEETDLLDVKHTIFPNPTNGRVTIQLSGKDYNLTNSINIYSVNGSLVKRININNPTNQMDLDISNMPSGTYLIHMHFTNGTVKTEQIIKN